MLEYRSFGQTFCLLTNVRNDKNGEKVHITNQSHKSKNEEIVYSQIMQFTDANTTNSLLLITKIDFLLSRKTVAFLEELNFAIGCDNRGWGIKK